MGEFTQVDFGCSLVVFHSQYSVAAPQLSLGVTDKVRAALTPVTQIYSGLVDGSKQRFRTRYVIYTLISP